jgi:hypothetical protein
MIVSVKAQDISDTTDNTDNGFYLFSKFSKGIVKFKSGAYNEALLNYNTLFGQMIFKGEKAELALDKLNTIDTVYIQDRKFIPVDTLFYEIVADKEQVPLFISYTCMVSLKPNAGFGTTSQTGSVDVLSDYRLGVTTPMQLNSDKYKITPQITFLLKKNNSYIQITKVNNLYAFFPGKIKSIKSYVKEHDVYFDNVDEITKLILFCNHITSP